MTIVEFLEQFRKADRKVRLLQREIEKEQFLIDSIQSPLGGSGLPHGTDINKSVERRAIKLADKLNEYKSMSLRTLEIRQQIFDVVMKVGGIEGELLFEYYIDYFNEQKNKAKTWDDVAERIHVDTRTVYRIKKRAFKKLSLFVSI